MLEKCAVANALRWAFPETLGNMYIADEMEKSTGQAPKPVNHVEKTQKVEVIPQQQITETIDINPEPSNIEPERDIEDIRGELLDFLKTLPDEWFVTLKKIRANLIMIVENEKTLEGIKQIYAKAMEYDAKYKEMTK
jgi:hypothetical protein